MPATIDGDEIEEVTIGGDDVDEITLDDDVVWKKGDFVYRAGDSQGNWDIYTNADGDYVEFGSDYLEIHQESTSSSRGYARVVLGEKYVNVEQYNEIWIEWECVESNSSDNESRMAYGDAVTTRYDTFDLTENGIDVSDIDPDEVENDRLQVTAWGTFNSGDSHTIRVYNIWRLE